MRRGIPSARCRNESAADIALFDHFVGSTRLVFRSVSINGSNGTHFNDRGGAGPWRAELKPVPTAVFRVNESDLVDGKCTPHPIGTLTDKIEITGARDAVAAIVVCRSLMVFQRLPVLASL